MKDKKLNYLEASFLVLIVTITHLVLNLPNSLIQSTGSSAVINVIYITILAFLMFFFTRKMLSPFENNNILYVAEYVGGKLLCKVLSFLYIIHFIFVAGVLLRSFAETLLIIYFPQASMWTILLAFLLVSLIVNRLGVFSVIKANTILMVPILITIIVTAISLIGKFELHRIFPIMGYGFKETFISGASNIYSFSGLLYLYLIKTNLKNYKDFTKVGIISIIISAIYLILTVAALLMMFPFLTSDNQALSVYLSTRIIEYGKFMQRTDALYMFVWIFAFMSYLSVIILYIKQISKESFQIQNTTHISSIVALFIFIIASLPQNESQRRFLEITLYKYSSLGIVFALSLIILILGYIKKKKGLKHEVS